MFNVGMYGGSFNPLHLGHVNDIINAANVCNKLYVVLSVTESPNEIDYRERLAHIYSITNDMENVEVITMFDKTDDKDKHDWQEGANYIKNTIGTKIDAVFAGSDYKGKNIWESLYPESKIIYFDREEVKISSTQIRSNTYKYFECLPKRVQEYYTKKVCVVGTESCGKSTLVRNLAKYFNTSYAPEAGRFVCEEVGLDNMKKKDYFEILFRHKELERKALERANKVLFIDTDSLITLYYYQLQFGNNDKNFESIATAISNFNNYDLYLFLEPDVKWIQDGTRTYGDEEVRKQNNEILKSLLDKNNINYVCIKGDYQERYEQSKEKVKQLIGRK